jgi:hypothetical protein
MALLAFAVAIFRPRLEQKVLAQSPTQVAGCDATSAPSRTNPCLVISAFRENGPGGTVGSGNQDEFVEIFNASATAVTVSSLSDDPNGTANGIGVFAGAGHGFNPQFGQAQNAASLACQIPGNTVIKGRSWVLCAGQTYTLSNLGGNGGRFDSRPDFIIGTNNASLATRDLPDDAGLALLNIGSNIVTQCPIGSFLCPTGFVFSGGTGNAIVLDKVGFNPYGQGSPENTGPGTYPANIYPSLAAQYCEGPLTVDANGITHSVSCLQPVGDASVVPLGPNQPCPGPLSAPLANPQNPSNPIYGSGPPTNPVGANQYDTNFPVDAGTAGGPFILRADGVPSNIRKCFGESGQYKIERRRSASTGSDTRGEIHRDSWNSEPTTAQLVGGILPTSGAVGACAISPTPAFCGNSEDFMLDAPNSTTANVGVTETGVNGVKAVLGAAGPHSCAAGQGCTSTSQTLGSPPVIGNSLVSLLVFDPNCAGLLTCPGFANAERRYSQDASVLGTANDPLGVLILRFRIVNNTSVPLAGGRFRINDLATLCGGQSYAAEGATGAYGSTTLPGTQEARNLRGPDNSIPPILTPTPTCGTSGANDGSDGANAFTAIVKGLNSPGEFVVDSTLTMRNVNGSVLEDTTVATPGVRAAPGSHQPFGGASDSSYVLNTVFWPNTGVAVSGGFPGVGDGANAGTGSFAALNNGTTTSTKTKWVGFKFGVVKSGRLKVTIGREIFGPTPVP